MMRAQRSVRSEVPKLMLRSFRPARARLSSNIGHGVVRAVKLLPWHSTSGRLQGVCNLYPLLVLAEIGQEVFVRCLGAAAMMMSRA